MSAKRKVVAIVDNDPAMLKALERLLVAHGFGVEAFGSAGAFLQRQAGDVLVCLVLDIQLDSMSGIQLRRQLSALGCPLPVIFMTGFDRPEVRQEAATAGCVAYLVKPFTAASLIGAVDKAAG